MPIRLRSSGGRISDFLLKKIAVKGNAVDLRQHRRSRILQQLADSDPTDTGRSLIGATLAPSSLPAASPGFPPVGDLESNGVHAEVDLREATLERLASLTALAADRDAELAFRAHHDALTGLPNRHAFEELANHGLAYARRYNRPLAILFIDLDGFKSVNDSFGHACGDAVLREVGRRFQSALRQSDLIARWGGDEFVAALPEVGSIHEATRAAEKILATLRDPLRTEGGVISLSASVGISIYPDDGSDLKALIESADYAMYQQKRFAGREALPAVVPPPSHSTQARLIESQLRFALQRGEFILHYQPQFDLHTGRACSLEALIRWQHPRLGLMQAGSFLPLAQNSRLILPISAWTLETACGRLAGLEQGIQRAPRVTVNISAAHLFQDDFLTSVANALDRTGADPRFLELDFPETVLAQDLDAVAPKLRHLKQLGIRLSADDFGSSRTALDYVQRLPLDSIKLHPSLLRGLAPDHRPLLIESVVALAQSAGIRAVAEGVETVQELNLIRSVGCDAAQGYLLGMPAPVEELLAAPETLSLPF